MDVEGKTRGVIGSGLLVFVGIAKGDTTVEADYLLTKVQGLRIFEDAAGKMNLSVQEIGGSLLLVSQFTLYADCRKGRRPNFTQAAPPEEAVHLYNYLVETARKGPTPVETGVFQASMQVHLVNDGPVTILIDSAER